MGLFKKLTKGVVDTILLPADVIRDVATIKVNEPHTKNRLKKIVQDLEDAYDSLDED